MARHKVTEMREAIELRFKSDAYTVESMPMARLAQYMGDLAAMLGEPATVHFVRLDPGSVGLVHRIEYEAYPKIEERIARVQRGDAPADAMRAFQSIDRRLREDNGSGEITRMDQGARIIEFPGRLAVRPMAFGPVAQQGSVDGVLIRLGGKLDLVPVHIEAGTTTYSKCFATREVARELGHHLFSDELRFHGQAQWARDESGAWNLEHFKITHFEVLDRAPLSAVVARLRAIRGAGWENVSDPWDELQRLRDDAGGEVH